MQKQSSRKFTVGHRMLHWAIVLGITVLFITGFLRMEWMGKAAVSDAVREVTGLSKDQGVAVYKTLRAPMWKWHVYAAYLIMIVYGLRLIYMLVRGVRFPRPFSKNSTPLERFEGFIYILFYLFLTVNVVTGFYMRWIDGNLKASFETVHKLAIYWVPGFVLLHIAGIWIGELSHKKGVVSKMIGGD